jgi:hypothetical protein
MNIGSVRKAAHREERPSTRGCWRCWMQQRYAVHPLDPAWRAGARRDPTIAVAD